MNMKQNVVKSFIRRNFKLTDEIFIHDVMKKTKEILKTPLIFFRASHHIKLLNRTPVKCDYVPERPFPKKAVEKAANQKTPLISPNSMIGQFTVVFGTAVLGTAFLG